MDEALAAEYRQTDYRVRLPVGGFAVIHVDRAAPAALREEIDGHAWSVITAWNPMSRETPRDRNRLAQRKLLAELRALPGVTVVRAAIGVGRSSWREPSLFVVGLAPELLEPLCQRYRQRACVVGVGIEPARLHWVAYAD